jgi:hypothetical protein
MSHFMASMNDLIDYALKDFADWHGRFVH